MHLTGIRPLKEDCELFRTRIFRGDKGVDTNPLVKASFEVEKFIHTGLVPHNAYILFDYDEQGLSEVHFIIRKRITGKMPVPPGEDGK